jgi:hypothetical protein
MATAIPSIEQVFCLSSKKVFTVFKKGVNFGSETALRTCKVPGTAKRLASDRIPAGPRPSSAARRYLDGKSM